MMIIYEDENILAVNKKAGEFVQSAEHSRSTLFSDLSKKYGKLYIVHRLDTPASGIIVFARNKKTAADLSRQFSEGLVEKRYICAVDSAPPEDSGRLAGHILIPSGKKGNKVYVKPEAGKNTKKAVLDYRLLSKTEKYHIIEVKLITGRKHQIRAQLAAAGCHIKGDVKYGAKRTNPGGGIHLHAYRLSFKLSDKDKALNLEAPLPDDPVWNAVPPELFSETGFQQ